jgi:quercetin dioxygenase-like cupin family protein
MQKMMIPEPIPAFSAPANRAGELSYQADKFAHKNLLEQDGQKATLFAFSIGQELKTHTTPRPALLIMLEGTCLFQIQGTSRLLTAGEVITIPANIPHSLSAATNFKMVLVR